jgi:predicted Zn finger-like uncharacterized protein
MSLATRCPACGTIFRVVQDQLKVSEGWVRCGQCHEVFHGIEALFDLESDPSVAARRASRAAATPLATRAFADQRASAPIPMPTSAAASPSPIAIPARQAAPPPPATGPSTFGPSDYPPAAPATRPGYTGFTPATRSMPPPPAPLAPPPQAMTPAAPTPTSFAPVVTRGTIAPRFAARLAEEAARTQAPPSAIPSAWPPAPVPVSPVTLSPFGSALQLPRAPGWQPSPATAPADAPAPEVAPAPPPRSEPTRETFDTPDLFVTRDAYVTPTPFDTRDAYAAPAPFDTPAAVDFPIDEPEEAHVAEPAPAPAPEPPPPPIYIPPSLLARRPEPSPAPVQWPAQAPEPAQAEPPFGASVPVASAALPSQSSAADLASAFAAGSPDDDSLPAFAVVREPTPDIGGSTMPSLLADDAADESRAGPPTLASMLPEDAGDWPPKRSKRKAADPNAPTTEVALVDRTKDPRFLREARSGARWRKPWVRAVLSLSLLLLVVAAVGQVAWPQRDTLAARWPATLPAWQWICQQADCRIEAPRAIASLALDGSSLTRTDTEHVLLFAADLHNRADHAVRMPSFDVTFMDLNGEIVSRKVLTPDQLGIHQDALPAEGELHVHARLQVGTLAASGFQADLFYP